jgi:acyl-CoA thioesterase FadM
MRWIRLLAALLAAPYKGKLSLTDSSTLPFRVWLTDIDVSIMNHAAMLSVMEAGRIDFMVRTGFFRLAKKYKWYFPSRSLSVQFFRPLKVFQKATLVTRVFHIDEKWIYMEQKIVSGGKDVAVCIVKSIVKSGREVVDFQKILKELGMESFPSQAKAIVEAHEEENRLVTMRLCHFPSAKGDESKQS